MTNSNAKVYSESETIARLESELPHWVLEKWLDTPQV